MEKVITAYEAYRTSMSKVPSVRLFDGVMQEIENTIKWGGFCVSYPAEDSVPLAICLARLTALGYKAYYVEEMGRLIVSWDFQIRERRKGEE
jgi:hypothetical protein